jgi:hypothetical protein
MNCTQLLEADHGLDKKGTAPLESAAFAHCAGPGWQESEPEADDEFSQLSALKRLHIREARLRYYNAELQTPEGRIDLLGEIEFVKEQYRELCGDDSMAASPMRQKYDCELNLRHFGCEMEDIRQTDYDEAICREADLSETQARVLILSLEGRTLAEIAWRLKKTPQAVDDVLQTARDKFLSAQRKAGGPHLSDRFRLIHYSDTHGYTEWGKEFSKEHGHLPAYCRRCLADM